MTQASRARRVEPEDGGMLKDLLVHVDSGAHAAERLRLAVALAGRFGARLTGLFAETTSLGRSAVARRSPQNMARAASQARAAFEAAAGAAGLTSDWWQISPDEYGEVVGWTIVCSRHVDLAIFGQRDPARPSALPDDLVEQVIAKSGRPVLVVPHFGRHPDVGKRILVAWTGSREAVRALNDAMPLLRRAERIQLLSLQLREAPGTVPGPAVDIVAHLHEHGVEAEQTRVAVEDLGAVANVLNAAAELVADLVVMGDHDGGAVTFGQRSTTTRDLLSSMTTAVLLSR